MSRPDGQTTTIGNLSSGDITDTLDFLSPVVVLAPDQLTCDAWPFDGHTSSTLYGGA